MIRSVHSRLRSVCRIWTSGSGSRKKPWNKSRSNRQCNIKRNGPSLSNKIPALFHFREEFTYAVLFHARHAAAGVGAVDDVSARQKPRGGGIYRSPFRYTPEDVACEYCQNYVRKHPCRLCECTCLEERIEAGVLELNAFMWTASPPLWAAVSKKDASAIQREETSILPILPVRCPPAKMDTLARALLAFVRPNKAALFLLTAYESLWRRMVWKCGMTALTSKASGSEESSRSYTASTRRRRPLRSAAVISLSQTLRLRNWSQMSVPPDHWRTADGQIRRCGFEFGKRSE